MNTPSGKPRKVIPIASADPQNEIASLYEAQKKVYPRSISGYFARWRWILVFFTQIVFYGLPWLQWGERQIMLFDLGARRFYLFGLVLYPQDFIYLTTLLIISALALFLFTAVAGRLWCGFACPQTVYTEIFMWIEHKIEGDRSARLRLDGSPWTFEKIWKKTVKQFLWIAVSVWTGFTFVGYFVPIRQLGGELMALQGTWQIFWVLFYGFATYGNAGFLREQVCKYMCPYARFQSAMFDRDTLIIAYDPMRGEPRGPRRKGLASVLSRARGLLDVRTAYDYVFRASQHPSAAASRLQAAGTVTLADVGTEAAPLPKFEQEELGDCIDCTLCVQVCPVGIDIRNGLQYECIACGACIDACDDVMDKMGMPHGLIRYTTQHALDGQAVHVVRPRILVYSLLLAALVSAWVWGVFHRSPLIADVLRDRNALYQQQGDHIANGYTLKLVNKTDADHVYKVSIDGTGTLALTLKGGPLQVRVPAGQVVAQAVEVGSDAPVTGRHDLRFVIEASDGSSKAQVDSTFFGPM